MIFGFERKNFGGWLRRHWATLLCLVGTIILDIVLNVVTTVTLTQNFVFITVIALNLTFLADFSRSLDDSRAEMKDLRQLLPESRISTYQSVDKVAAQLYEMVKSGTHRVDMVMYDNRIRTTDRKKVARMLDFVHYCVKTKRITLRYAFCKTPESLAYRLNWIVESIENSNSSFFAFQDTDITFASFMIIDGTYVSIRTPHKHGSMTAYCIVKEQNLCQLYSSWFDLLWEEATKIDRANVSNFFHESIDSLETTEAKLLAERIVRL